MTAWMTARAVAVRTAIAQGHAVSELSNANDAAECPQCNARLWLERAGGPAAGATWATPLAAHGAPGWVLVATRSECRVVGSTDAPLPPRDEPGRLPDVLQSQTPADARPRRDSPKRHPDGARRPDR